MYARVQLSEKNLHNIQISVINYRKKIADRTKASAIRIIKACSFLDEKPSISKTLSERLLCCGTSIGATRFAQILNC